ncbi:MAG: 3-oxoacyl-[acyl-carrier-protein] synthase III C-terminal domain-containing protein, partial [Nanoarchaeota archaeon]
PVDLVLLATNTSVSDPLAQAGFPCIAGDVQQRITGLIRDKCGISDIQSGCVGINYASAFGDGLIRAGYLDRVLVIGADILSRIVDFNDRSTCVLFGDGAAAYVLDVSDLPGFVGHRFYGDGAKRGIITSPLRMRRYLDEPKNQTSYAPTLIMDGGSVHEEVIKILVNTFANFENDLLLNPYGVNFSEVAKIIPHQANCRTIETAARKIAKMRSKLGVDANSLEDVRSKFIVTIDEYANNSTASQGPGLEEVLYGENCLKEGEHVVMCSYGSGFSACFNHYVV